MLLKHPQPGKFSRRLVSLSIIQFVVAFGFGSSILIFLQFWPLCTSIPIILQGRTGKFLDIYVIWIGIKTVQKLQHVRVVINIYHFILFKFWIPCFHHSIFYVSLILDEQHG